MTLKGGTSQACAACKYQRRRCTSECVLAPYFPPDQPKLFQNAHKLFGVSNILKILKNLKPDEKATAMWSIMYQANERDRDPVHGCLGKICTLRYQIWAVEQELISIQAHLDLCRHNHNHGQTLDLVMAPPTSHIASCYGHENGQPFENGYMVDQPLDLQQEVIHDYDELPFFDTMDDRQSFIDSKEAYDSSCEESVLKDTNQSIEHIDDNELKNAAACFSLTSVN